MQPIPFASSKVRRRILKPPKKPLFVGSKVTCGDGRPNEIFSKSPLTLWVVVVMPASQCCLELNPSSKECPV